MTAGSLRGEAMLAGLTSCPCCAARVQIVSTTRQQTEGTPVHVVDATGERRAAIYQTQTRFAEPERPEAGWTLQEWWERRCEPAMRAEGKSRARMCEYRTYLRRWQGWLKATKNHGTATPVVGTINPVTLSEFRTYLKTTLLLSERAADKHLAGISALLKRAADEWILPRVAKLKPVGAGPAVAQRWVFLPEDLDALYAACAGVVWPNRFGDGSPCENPADYWRAYLVAGWNLGFRPQEWWAYEASAEPITWSGVSWDREREIQGRSTQSAQGWLSWVQSKTGHRLELPMHAAVREHLWRLWQRLPPERREPQRKVFDFPATAGTKKPGKTVTPADGFYAAWWDLVERAGLEPHQDASGRKTTHCPSHFRKTAHTLHRDNVVDVDGRPVLVGDAADFVTGHSGGRNVSLRHYYRSINIVRATCESLRQPESFMS